MNHNVVFTVNVRCSEMTKLCMDCIFLLSWENHPSSYCVLASLYWLPREKPLWTGNAAAANV